MRKKVITIVGARPQFIKAGVVSNALDNIHNLEEVILHTGQHFDKNMSQVFFDELSIPKPTYNLSISGLSHGAMTGRMLEKIEEILLSEQPELVLVYGDTDSTLAGALAASKLDIPLAHIEAGLRSRNLSMPEEKNRLVTDALSQLLFCPSENALNNLIKENISDGVSFVGDVMFDALLLFKEKINKKVKEKNYSLKEKDYVLCTIHRKENTNNINRLIAIFKALEYVATEIDIVLPLHPRTKAVIFGNNLISVPNNIKIIDPLSYLEFLDLQINAKCIFTDSGGLQKEAFFNSVPCITLRDETEWVETVELGWNVITGSDTDKIISAWNNIEKKEIETEIFPYGRGNASEKISEIISTYLE
tara:strand:+ start:40 stop:1125 length:1086 start_codon:yes stop_codon:yes gene_type:complete